MQVIFSVSEAILKKKKTQGAWLARTMLGTTIHNSVELTFDGGAKRATVFESDLILKLINMVIDKAREPSNRVAKSK